MSSVSSKPEAKPYFTLRLPSMLVAGFLSVMTLLLAYLGGVMTGRGYWHAHPEVHVEMERENSPDIANSNNAISSLGKKSETEQDDKILAPEELRFARVLRNESVVADAPQKPQAQTQSVMAQSAATASDLSVNKVRTAAGAGITASPPIDKQQVSDIQPAMYDFVFQVGAFKDEDTVDAIRQRLEGRGLRTRMQRSGKLYVVLVLLRGDATRAGEVQRATESLGLGKPIQRSRKPVLQP